MFRKNKVCQAVMLALGGSLALAAMPTLAQDAQRVEITGSSIKRAESEGALPVQVITRDEIARSGVQNTEELVGSLSAISSSGGVANATGVGSSTYGLSTISLRGLQGARTLVLVNGRRLAPFAGGAGASVNVNSIPLAAIERVEVLTDGASAVYGSDAVAGVVNFILSKNVTGIELAASTSTPTRSGGGQQHRASIVTGFGNLAKDRFSVTASLTLEKEDALFAKDRAFAATGNQFPYLVAGATGQGNIEGAYTPGTGSVAGGNWVEGSRQAGFGNSPGSGYGNPMAALDKCADIKMFKNPTNTTKGTPFCAYDSAQDVGLIPKKELTALTLNGAFRVSDALELFGDALYSRSIIQQTYQPSPVRRSFLISDSEFAAQGVDPALLIYPTNPNYQIAADYLNSIGQGALVGQPLAITARVFDFGLRSNRDVATQMRLVAGARGSVANQDYELALTHNESKIAGSVPSGYFSQVAYAKAVQASNEWNPWSLTQTAAFNNSIAGAKYTGATLNGKFTTDSFDSKISGDIMALPAGTLQYAAGAQYRREKFDYNPSDALLSGDIAGLGGASGATNASRNVKAVFAELNVPVLKSLEAGVSLRNDNYSDFGNTTNYKVNFAYRPMAGVLIRASKGSGFRAPTLRDLYDPQLVGTSAQFRDPVTGQANLQVPQLSGGNPDLKPETSSQNSIGFVFSPNRNVTVGIDWFNIRLKDIITTPSAQEVVSGFRKGDSAYANSVTLSASGDIDSIKVVTTNTGGAIIRGVDLDAAWRDNFSFGTLGVKLNGTYFNKFDQTSPGGVVSHKVGTIVDENGDPVLDADGGGVVLRWKHRLALTWSQGPWSTTFGQNFYTGYETGWRQIDGERNFIGDQAIYDAQVTYTGIKNLKLTAGVKNLFDKNPAIFVPVSNQFQSGYDVNQYDPRARTVYLAASYKF